MFKPHFLLTTIAIFITIGFVFTRPIKPQVIGISSSNVYTSLPPTDQTLPTITTSPTFSSWLNRLEIIAGTTTIKSLNSKSTLTLKKNQYFSPTDDDQITTNSSSLTSLNFYEGTSIRTLGKSIFVYSTPSLQTKLTLTSGLFYLRFTPIPNTLESIIITTPHEEHTLNSGAILVDVTKDKSSFIVLVGDNPAPKSALTKYSLFLEFNSLADRSKPVALKYSELIRGNCPDCPKFKEVPTLNPIATLSATLFQSSPDQAVSNLPIITSLSGEGLVRSQVKTDFGTFPLTCIGANKNTTKIVTDSANDDDCTSNCPTLPLADYVSRNGGFAGMNGSYFCPADYPTCDAKKNTFDTLLFNYRLSRYLNSGNNIYSTLPFWVFFNDGNTRLVNQTLGWGRDTNISGGIAGNPLLVSGGKSILSTDNLDNKQKTATNGTNAIVEKENFIYFCHLAKATIPQSAKIYEILGANTAMNTDGGGSAALYSGGYKVGPGRNIPNALIMVKR